MRALGGLRGKLVCGQRGLGAANANLRNGDRRVGLKAGVCLEGLAAMVGHARRVSRHVTVKIVTLHVGDGRCLLSKTRPTPELSLVPCTLSNSAGLTFW